MPSTVATVSFLQQHRARVPVPKLLDFHIEAEDPVQAPYLLSDLAEGSILKVREWIGMSFESQVSVLRVVANVFPGLFEPITCGLRGSLLCPGHASSFQLPPPFTSYAIMALLPRQKRPPEQEFPDHITPDPTRPITLFWIARYDSAFRAYEEDTEHSSSASAHRVEELHTRLVALARSAAVAGRLSQRPPALVHVDFSLFRNVLFIYNRPGACLRCSRLGRRMHFTPSALSSLPSRAHGLHPTNDC